MSKSISYRVLSNEAIDDLVRRLSCELPLCLDQSRELNRYIIDTFDWRLHAGRWLLLADEDRSGVTLRMFRLQDTACAEWIVSQEHVPDFAEDIRDRRLRSILKPIAQMRALIPKARLCVQQKDVHYAQKREDWGPRLRIEYAGAECGDSGRLFFDGRVMLFPERSRKQAIAAVTQCLGREMGLQITKASLYEHCLRAGLLMPSTRSYKSVVSLEAGSRSDVALKRILLYWLDEIESNEKGVLAATDTEFLHDFRVAVRRTRTLLGISRGIIPERQRQRFRAGFAWLGAITGPMRDTHVYLLNLDHYRKLLPKPLQAGLDPLHELLLRRQQDQHLAMVTRLSSNRFRVLKQAWRSYLQASVPANTRLAVARTPIADSAKLQIEKRYRQIVKHGRKIDRRSPDSDLHGLRIRCKKLRYVLDSYRSLCGSAQFKKVLAPLKQLQENLGEYQDLSVQRKALPGFADQIAHDGLGGEASAATLLALAQKLEARQAKCRQDFYRCFRRFDSSDIRRAMERILV